MDIFAKAPVSYISQMVRIRGEENTQPPGVVKGWIQCLGGDLCLSTHECNGGNVVRTGGIETTCERVRSLNPAHMRTRRGQVLAGRRGGVIVSFPRQIGLGRRVVHVRGAERPNVLAPKTAQALEHGAPSCGECMFPRAVLRRVNAVVLSNVVSAGHVSGSCPNGSSSRQHWRPPSRYHTTPDRILAPCATRFPQRVQVIFCPPRARLRLPLSPRRICVVHLSTSLRGITNGAPPAHFHQPHSPRGLHQHHRAR
ncbi:hypothetical protein K458DRAFT_90361 [Lentithecium fluviatile CBS 122367]|uniref:Uncharacterized protein n=1 Tax=Lentithecium fluviatile CBS 122367 TaxID=1168545 RepID=A0A6G1IQT6_9PLEO|nr:hypothetical protein K458DRAFT_90361 [Lentithecium fluviatile CBS 122367]